MCFIIFSPFFFLRVVMGDDALNLKVRSTLRVRFVYVHSCKMNRKMYAILSQYKLPKKQF